VHIYRFFHPHHNPRLLRIKLRQQELGELEQAAAELRKAIERAVTRLTRKPVPPLSAEHFAEVVNAIRFVEGSLQKLCQSHPGDESEDTKALIAERASFVGWDTWSRLAAEQLQHLADEEKPRKTGS
jgi:hypothetical protein